MINIRFILESLVSCFQLNLRIFRQNIVYTQYVLTMERILIANEDGGTSASEEVAWKIYWHGDKFTDGEETNLRKQYASYAKTPKLRRVNNHSSTTELISISYLLATRHKQNRLLFPARNGYNSEIISWGAWIYQTNAIWRGYQNWGITRTMMVPGDVVRQ